MSEFVRNSPWHSEAFLGYRTQRARGKGIVLVVKFSSRDAF